MLLTLPVVEPRPFHESVVGLIEKMGPAHLVSIGVILITTRIPANHDTIAKAFADRCKAEGWKWEDIGVVTESIAAQKEGIKKDFRDEISDRDLS